MGKILASKKKMGKFPTCSTYSMILSIRFNSFYLNPHILIVHKVEFILIFLALQYMGCSVDVLLAVCFHVFPNLLEKEVHFFIPRD
jgi:hypothetical protein